MLVKLDREQLTARWAVADAFRHRAAPSLILGRLKRERKRSHTREQQRLREPEQQQQQPDTKRHRGQSLSSSPAVAHPPPPAAAAGTLPPIIPTTAAVTVAAQGIPANLDALPLMGPEDLAPCTSATLLGAANTRGDIWCSLHNDLVLGPEAAAFDHSTAMFDQGRLRGPPAAASYPWLHAPNCTTAGGCSTTAPPCTPPPQLQSAPLRMASLDARPGSSSKPLQGPTSDKAVVAASVAAGLALPAPSYAAVGAATPQPAKQHSLGSSLESSAGDSGGPTRVVKRSDVAHAAGLPMLRPSTAAADAEQQAAEEAAAAMFVPPAGVRVVTTGYPACRSPKQQQQPGDGKEGGGASAVQTPQADDASNKQHRVETEPEQQPVVWLRQQQQQMQWQQWWWRQQQHMRLQQVQAASDEHMETLAALAALHGEAQAQERRVQMHALV